MPISPVTDCFASLNLKATLILKACGFIEAHRARILDIGEGFIKVRIGARWWERWLFVPDDPWPMEVVLTIRDDISQEERRIGRGHLPAADYGFVSVAVRPVSRRWSETEFHEEARRLLWSLRFHFMAC